MSIEEELFNKYEVDKDKLIKYGFVLDDNKYKYEKYILDNKFKIIVEYDKKVKAHVIDLEFNDEYVNYRMENLGEFSANIKKELISLLTDIRNKCFERNTFKYKQTRRINEYIINKYDVNPEFLWEKFPNFAIYRKTKKWFALISDVARSKVDKSSDSSDSVELINLKVNEEKIDNILANTGIYEAYHMNKRNWISIILDEALSDDAIIKYIDDSYNLINEKVSWIVPANPKYYDIVSAFNENNEIIWKQSSDINVGDIVYIYVAEPYSKVLYKTEATEVNIPYEYKDNNVSMKYVMKLKLIKDLNDKEYTFKYLNSLGIKAIRGPRKINKTISDKLL